MALNFLNYVFTPSIMSHVFRLGNGIKMIVGNGDWGKLKKIKTYIYSNENEIYIYVELKLKLMFCSRSSRSNLN